jgi:hypothetical protein
LFLLGALTLAALALVPRYGRRWMQIARRRPDDKRTSGPAATAR